MELELAIAVSPRAWDERLHRFVADHGGARVRTRVLRAEDATAEHYDVLIIDDITSYLSRRLVQQVQRLGRHVVGVYDPEEFPEGKQRLSDLGADAVIEAQASPDEFLRVVSGLATIDVAEQIVDLPSPTPYPETERGRITVIGGPSGGTGTTEVALTLAAQLRTTGASVVLVDGDDVAPSVAQRLGLDLHPNVRTAVDILLHRTGWVPDALIPVKQARFEVLAGLPNPKDWFELRPGDVIDVAMELAAVRNHVVVNVSSQVEDLSALGAQNRFGLSRGLIGVADSVVCVAEGSPVGVARALEWLADVRPIAEGVAIHLCVNRVGRSSFKQRQLSDELLRSFSPDTLTFLPEDKRVSEAAWSGDVVLDGAFAKAVGTLVRHVRRAAPIRRVR